MTLSTLLIYVGIAAAILTALVYFVFKKRESPVMSYVQNFCGALFIFSGWVKAVDPLGTAYKMEQYFDQFEAVAQGTAMSFLAPMFPFLSSYAIQFSVFMVVLEIVLGIMLIIGQKPKLTAWIFFLLVVFFTILTGFTFLTGYVPGDVNFFEFGSWAEYDKNNMKVTDCGCFGDFIKLEPKISFYKDIFLLLPSIFFLMKSKAMHVLFNRGVRNGIVLTTTVGLLAYCMSNYVWDIPHKDFRDFKVNRDVAERRQLERDAMADLQILAYKMENKETGEKVELPYAEYLQRFKEFPSEQWDLEQVYSEPTIKETKISTFDIFALEDGHNLADDILEGEDPVLMIVAHKLNGSGSPATKVVRDTIYQVDSLLQDDGTYQTIRNVKRIDEEAVEYIDYIWEDGYAKRYRDVVIPFAKKAQEAGVKVIAAIGSADETQIRDFQKDLDFDVTYGTADDILLKTIVRSNPGMVLFDDGVILNKWHHNKLPSFEEVAPMLK